MTANLDPSMMVVALMIIALLAIAPADAGAIPSAPDRAAG